MVRVPPAWAPASRPGTPTEAIAPAVSAVWRKLRRSNRTRRSRRGWLTMVVAPPFVRTLDPSIRRNCRILSRRSWSVKQRRSAFRLPADRARGVVRHLGADLKGDLDIRTDKSGEVEVLTARGSTRQ